MSTTFDRIKRAVMLDATFYQEAERDTTLNQEALIIVIVTSVAGAIGALIGGIIGGNFGQALLSAVITGIVGVINYYVWSYVTYFVGKNLFGGDADVGELLRTLGYAHAPRLLSLLSFIPCVGWVFVLAGAVLSLIAAVIAIREALDFDTSKAVLTAIIGWVIILVISLIITGIFGGFAAVGSLLTQR